MTTFENGISINSGSPELDEKIHEWLDWDKNVETRNEIKKLVEQSNWDKLKKRLCNRLAFGTAGLRGRMQAGFDSMNDLVVIQTAQGFCQYILDTFPNENDRKRGIVLGYDGRYNSRRFAELTACIFINKGIPVWLYSKMVATPFVPFAIVERNFLAGVMVTASHNPKEDNGYKVYWANGAQIISPHDKNIQNSILSNLKPLETSWNVHKLTETELLKDPFGEMFALYFRKLLNNIPKAFIENNDKSNLKFVYTAMHGVGYPFVKQAFSESKLQPLLSVKEQQEADPEFPTVKFPNPEEGKSSLVLSMKLAEKENVNIILANDPDADRLACAEKNPITGQWKVFSGNELGTLLGWWSIKCYKEQNPSVKDLSNCYLLASTVSSKMLDSMAKIEECNFVETLTGFKWMGNKSIELIKTNKTVLFAFEEAIGFMFSPIVLDKDGVSAACHLATMSCYLRNEENVSLTEKLNQLYNKYGYHCTITSYFLCYEPEIIKNIFERLRNYNHNDHYPESILNGKYEINSVRDLTTGQDSSQKDGKALLPASKSTQMITFRFMNGVVVTLRTSGTEPKIKYYAEICADPKEKDWNKLKEVLNDIVDGVVEEFLQPHENNLTPQTK